MNSLLLPESLHPFLSDIEHAKLHRYNQPYSHSIEESDEHLKIVLTVPGVRKNDLEITLEDRMLVVKTKDDTQKDEEKQSHNYFQYHFSFKLPENADTQQDIDANLELGLLKLTIPKKEKHLPKRMIEISHAS